jgi:ascorbate-specific PTS system EIIC-type component UlaA
MFVLFFVVHIVQVVIAGWRNFQSMITGHEVVDTEPTVIAEVRS